MLTLVKCLFFFSVFSMLLLFQGVMTEKSVLLFWFRTKNQELQILGFYWGDSSSVCTQIQYFVYFEWTGKLIFILCNEYLYIFPRKSPLLVVCGPTVTIHCLSFYLLLLIAAFCSLKESDSDPEEEVKVATASLPLVLLVHHFCCSAIKTRVVL